MTRFNYHYQTISNHLFIFFLFNLKIGNDFNMPTGMQNTTIFTVEKTNKNSTEVDIAPAFGEITTACNVGQAKKGHGA